MSTDNPYVIDKVAQHKDLHYRLVKGTCEKYNMRLRSEGFWGWYGETFHNGTHFLYYLDKHLPKGMEGKLCEFVPVLITNGRDGTSTKRGEYALQELRQVFGI